MESEKVRLAILDMNNGVPNQGLRCIKEIAAQYDDNVEWKVFDVRQKTELPDLTYDIFISSGGPGSPLDEGKWRMPYLDLLDDVIDHNKKNESAFRKHFFFICYSFQLACHHLGLGEVTRRRKTSFGVYPVHKTKDGEKEYILSGLDNPYYAVDSRDWQVVQPRLKVFEENGAKILSLEKIRTHVEYERAIMAVRFSDELVGTQFHPEADAEGMKEHFSKEEMKNKVIENFSKEKYYNMMEDVDDPKKVEKTHAVILPNFIEHALDRIAKHELVIG